MTSDLDTFIEDMNGPRLTPELSRQVRRSVLIAAGLEISDQEIAEIYRVAQFAFSNAFAPATTDSRTALQDFDKAASKLLQSLKAVKFQASEGLAIGRVNLAERFMRDAFAENEEEGERLGYIWEPGEYVERVISDVTLLQREAKKALQKAKGVEHGYGRKILGYKDFVLVCQRVWVRYRSDQGYSRKAGRGSGPFVRFVYCLQELIPRPKRKRSETAVGDAVVAALKDTS